jgi:hypothetical protein
MLQESPWSSPATGISGIDAPIEKRIISPFGRGSGNRFVELA